MKRKLFSMFLALVLCIGLLPMSAFAATGTVAQIGNTQYDTIEAAIAAAQDGDTVEIFSGSYDLDSTLNVDKSITIKGSGNLQTVLTDTVFDVDSASSTHEMNVVFENIKFEGTSRIIVGKRAHHNGVGGPDVLPLTKLTVKNCYAETTFSTDSLTGGKGQFIYLAATYCVKLDLTLDGNTFINNHSISNEDASPIVNGNGTVINKVSITNNTFGSDVNPCDRFAVKFARRANDAEIIIKNNTVYGATTADKDFYILDLWQSGSNVQNGLDIIIQGNAIECTPDEGRSVYVAYIEGTINGDDLTAAVGGNTVGGTAADNILNSSSNSDVSESTVCEKYGCQEAVIPAVAPTCTEKGFTEGKECSVCGKVIVAQKEISATDHNYKDGVCATCGAKDEAHIKPDTNQQDTNSPQTSDNSNMTLWGIMLVFAACAMLFCLFGRKHRRIVE